LFILPKICYLNYIKVIEKYNLAMFSRFTGTRQTKKEAQTILQLGDVYKALVAGEATFFSKMQMQQIIEYCFTNVKFMLVHFKWLIV